MIENGRESSRTDVNIAEDEMKLWKWGEWMRRERERLVLSWQRVRIPMATGQECGMRLAPPPRRLFSKNPTDLSLSFFFFLLLLLLLLFLFFYFLLSALLQLASFVTRMAPTSSTNHFHRRLCCCCCTAFLIKLQCLLVQSLGIGWN